ncbi:Tfp pilus assembly protein FimT/FimU [Synechococcus sp. PCC 6312]|uniref:pilus assembly FimT family protein n=1 Tax=Synechococcus sp. (strain ATCC 27167 / PCC 6312) TaxID=195253 RepID=UPI00029F0E9D|nr:GspH/FimT family pseudopilin [Synechococcus sp. PCC 6312]AFY62694.1 prepilin-type N-terminal cleavage/methylation domain-containing protein [Synechococcus sp. PCC 6312]
MRRLNVPNSKGFTLPEMLAVVVIIGILAAIFIPSFLAWLNNQRIRDGLVRVEGALKEAQREAIRQSKTCTVNVVTGSNASLSGNCLVTGTRRFDSNWLTGTIQIDSNRSDINFFVGGTTNAQGTIVVSMPNTNAQSLCLVISNGISLMRKGAYTGDISNPVATSCNTIQIQ